MGEENEQCDSINSWELNGLNSLDLWDYTVELECLQGTEGWLRKGGDSPDNL